MRFPDQLILIRGGGDLGTGVAWRLHRCGFPVVVSELAEPLAIRRAVALSSAVAGGEVSIEGVIGRRAESIGEAPGLARTGVIPVVVSAALPRIGAMVVVDARLAKRNLDTTVEDAPLVVGLGPGFTAGVDCHVVVETKRGHHLGRAIWAGSAEPDTGIPGEVGGKGGERVVRAPADGKVKWVRAIGEVVAEGDLLGRVGDAEVLAPCGGAVRGLIADGRSVARGLKIGDVDPRAAASACFEISDKALAVGGGVLEAVLTWMNR
jgi:xanthine dehydrogenase accessory factor